MRLAEVVIDVASKSLDDSYTYALPDGEGLDDVEVGCAVEVPFGGRRAVGFVIDVREGEPFDKLKPVTALLSRSYFDVLGAECARFLTKRYVAPLSVCVRLLTPPGGVPRMVRNPKGGWMLQSPQVDKVDDRWVVAGPDIDSFKPRANASKQIAVVDAVRQGDIRVSELNMLYGSVGSAVSSLEKKGVVRVERRRRMRTHPAMAKDEPAECAQVALEGDAEGQPPSAKCAPFHLTGGQEDALAAIGKAMDHRDGRVVLVDGVTGSGKTEVYLRAIRRALDEGKSAIVLVPEIALTPQTVARFRGRFGDIVAVLHSAMGAGERFDQWDLIREGGARVVVGARSALFAPVQNLGLVVIDEEHETTYKQESAPRYVSRDVAAWMVRRCGGTLVLGSATPSLESLYNANRKDNWTSVSMTERANGRPMPEVEVIDMALEFRGGSREMFSARLRSAMVGELSQGRKVVLLLNQRGFARFLLCRDCGFVPKCSSCSTTLTYHARGNRLVCHHCGRSVPAPGKCPECESPYLKKFGVGTQRVEDELRSLLDAEFGEMPKFAGAGVAEVAEASGPVPIVRMDADTTRGKGSHRMLLDRFAAAPRAVLLGTQMIAKGLDFDDVTLVGVVNADTQLHLPDFRASERTFDLVEQVAGRAGRGSVTGRVMVQTYEADDPAIQAAADYDREAFLRVELPKRKVLKYPPFVRMANVVAWGKDEARVSQHSTLIQRKARALAEANAQDGWEVLPAGPCVFEKIRDDHRWHFVVKCPVGKDLSAFLRDAYAGLKPAPGVNVAIDVDPVDLL